VLQAQPLRSAGVSTGEGVRAELGSVSWNPIRLVALAGGLEVRGHALLVTGVEHRSEQGQAEAAVTATRLRAQHGQVLTCDIGQVLGADDLEQGEDSCGALLGGFRARSRMGPTGPWAGEIFRRPAVGGGDTRAGFRMHGVAAVSR
jgi:hypothetical protein